MNELMSEFQMNIDDHITNYCKILRLVDPVLIELIEENQPYHLSYTLRWFLVLLSQELDLSDILRLWDSLLSAEGLN